MAGFRQRRHLHSQDSVESRYPTQSISGLRPVAPRNRNQYAGKMTLQFSCPKPPGLGHCVEQIQMSVFLACSGRLQCELQSSCLLFFWSVPQVGRDFFECNITTHRPRCELLRVSSNSLKRRRKPISWLVLVSALVFFTPLTFFHFLGCCKDPRLIWAFAVG